MVKTKDDNRVQQQGKMLVSFSHGVAIPVDGRYIVVWCAICEEAFQAATKVIAKTPEAEISDPKEAMNMANSLTLDFPMFLKVLGLGDGKPLKDPQQIMVKWNNISAICWLTKTP